MPVAHWIRRLAIAGVVLCFTVIVLGAYVRLTAAGLGCPDWPGCYGHVSPLGALQDVESQAAFASRPLDVGKAWREMAHRYAASTLGLIIVLIVAVAVASRRRPVVGIPFAMGLLATVVFQGILGMLTVTWQLKPLIVTSHLIFGLTTLGLLWWLWLSLPRNSANGLAAPAAVDTAVSAEAYAGARVVWRLTLVGLLALGVQIILGGWTSSNYAAIACPDFPKCQNAWWPHTDYRDAFVLWRGLGVNYEGGVLNNPARVAIHLTHRLGALVAALALCFSAVSVLRRPASSRLSVPAAAVLMALGLQLTIGVAMVEKGFPLWLATTHTAGAALLLLSVLALLRVLGAQRSADRSDTLERQRIHHPG
jgi:cytochrome c oxidase assembly protein subunit 15